MAESLAKDKRPNSGSSEVGKDNIEDMADWERRLVEGDLPEDFLEVTEPQEQDKKAKNEASAACEATGLLVDIPTVTASNSVPQDRIPPPNLLQGTSFMFFFRNWTCLTHFNIFDSISRNA